MGKSNIQRLIIITIKGTFDSVVEECVLLRMDCWPCQKIAHLHLVQGALKGVLPAGILTDFFQNGQLLGQLQLKGSAHAEAGISLDWSSHFCSVLFMSAHRTKAKRRAQVATWQGSAEGAQFPHTSLLFIG